MEPQGQLQSLFWGLEAAIWLWGGCLGVSCWCYTYVENVVLFNWLGGADGYHREVFQLGIISSSR